MIESELSKNDEVYSFKQAEKNIFELEKVLSANGVKIGKGNDLERLALGVLELFDKHQHPRNLDNDLDIRRWIRESLGMNHLVQKILRVKNHKNFAQLAKHLELLNRGMPAQNTFSCVTDQCANKIFELLVATTIMPYSTNLSLDDPDSSKGDNPDVIANINDKFWAFACKVGHAKKGKTLFNNLEKGIDQIERCSAVSTGVVIINLKNILEHDKYLSILNKKEWMQNQESPMLSGFNNVKEAKRVLEAEVLKIRDMIVSAYGPQAIIDLFEGKKSISGFLLYAHTTTCNVVSGYTIPTSIGFITSVPVLNTLSESDMSVLKVLNDGMQFKSRNGGA